MSKTVGQKKLEHVGFTVTKVYPGGKWFAVVSPDQEEGAVLRQSGACWHYFAKAYAGTASSSCAERCHLGGLGDAIGTDSQMRTYKRLLSRNVPRELQKYEGVYAAMGQVQND